MKVTEQIRRAGYGVSGIIGGQPKQKYWTPDGRIIEAPPNIHGLTDGSIRDANLDKGWLLTPPEKPKPYCPHCDMWHDTKTEITKCGVNRKKFDAKHAREAKRLLKINADESESLKQQVAQLTELVNKLLNKEKNG